MTHNISMVGGEAAAVYARKPAWHGLGEVLPDVFTAKDAMVKGHLDWLVTLEPIYTQDEILIPNRQATVRMDLPATDPQRVLGIVGPRYRAVQNHELFEFFDEVVDRGEAIYESAGALGNGGRVWLLAALPKSFWVKEDEFKQYILLTNGHTGWHGLKVLATSVRVVCQNTLSAALAGGKKDTINLRHTTHVKERFVDAAEIMGLATKRLRQMEQLFNQLVEKKVESTAQFEEFVRAIWPSNGDNDPDKKVNASTQAHRDGVYELFNSPSNQTQGTQNTWYAAVNAVTEYVDHDQKSRKTRLEHAVYGSGSVVKAKAVDLARKFAKIK